MPSKTRRAVFECVKSIIKHNYSEGDCGLFFTPNFAGDYMERLYDGGGVIVKICRHWSYFEVFGLTASEEEELKEYYYSLTREEEDVEEET